MDSTNYAYKETVDRLKYLLAESYTPEKFDYNSAQNQLITTKVTDRLTLSEISKYLKSRCGHNNRNAIRKLKNYSLLLRENPSLPIFTAADNLKSPETAVTDALRPPLEILHFIEKQEDYIEQLEKESSFCRNELSNLLEKVKDVINENEALTEHTRSNLATLTDETSISPEMKEIDVRKYCKSGNNNLSGPNIVLESRISELEAELTQALIDFKKLRTENDELRRKITSNSGNQIKSENELNEHLKKEKLKLEEQIKELKRTVENSQSNKNQSLLKTNRDLSYVSFCEKSQPDMEVRHLRNELERQHERIHDLQHEMSKRIAEERANAERRYNFQIEQIGVDLNTQCEQVSKLQIELERQKRLEVDLRRDLIQKNAQINDLKAELETKRSKFISDIAQLNIEKQSLEQEMISERLKFERSDHQTKVENARLDAEINSLKQRLNRADADLLHAKRENLRLSDEISDLEKKLTFDEMKNEMVPAKKDLNKSIAKMKPKYALEDYEPSYNTRYTTSTAPEQNDKNRASFAKSFPYEIESSSEIEEPRNNNIADSKQIFETTYGYTDDENFKDQFGEGHKFRNKENFEPTSSYVEKSDDFIAKAPEYPMQYSEPDYLVQDQQGYEQVSKSRSELNYEQSDDQRHEVNPQYQMNQQYLRDPEFYGNEQYTLPQGSQSYKPDQYQFSYEPNYDQTLNAKAQQQSIPISISESKTLPQISAPTTSISQRPPTSVEEQKSNFESKTNNDISELRNTVENRSSWENKSNLLPNQFPKARR